jgi:hypothetical protein
MSTDLNMIVGFKENTFIKLFKSLFIEVIQQMSSDTYRMELLSLCIQQHFQKEIKDKYNFVIRKLFSFLIYFMNFLVSFNVFVFLEVLISIVFFVFRNVVLNALVKVRFVVYTINLKSGFATVHIVRKPSDLLSFSIIFVLKFLLIIGTLLHIRPLRIIQN